MSIISVFELPNGKLVKISREVHIKVYVRLRSQKKVLLKTYNYDRIEDAFQFYKDLTIEPRFRKYFVVCEAGKGEVEMLVERGDNPQAAHPYRDDHTLRRNGRNATYAITISKIPIPLEEQLKAEKYVEFGIHALSPKRELILLLLAYYFSMDEERRKALVRSAMPKLERVRPRGRYDQEPIS